MKTIRPTLAWAKILLPLITVFGSTALRAQFSYALQRHSRPISGERNETVNFADPSRLTAFFSPANAMPTGRGEPVAERDPEELEERGPAMNAMRAPMDFRNARISSRKTSFIYPQRPGKDIGIDEFPVDRLLLYAAALKQYALAKGFDTTYAFLSNMGMLTSKKRFFVVNLVTMTVEQSGLVAQGRGLGPTRFDKQYSNIQDSKCTSLGRYRIARKYKGEYGVAYRMMGLDTSNLNAFNRNIVLHSMGCIPDIEDQSQVCISEGCPAVSASFLSALCRIIDSRKKPMLLWVFDSNLEDLVVEPAGDPDQDAGESPTAPVHVCALHRPAGTLVE